MRFLRFFSFLRELPGPGSMAVFNKAGEDSILHKSECIAQPIH